MTLQQEKKLVGDAQAGLEGFRQLYEWYYPKIFQFCLSRTLNKHLAEDLTAEVFLAAVAYLPKFDLRKDAGFGSWLYRVASNKIIDYWRQNRGVQINFPLELMELVKDDSQASAEENYAKYELKLQTAQVLKALKPRYQEALALRYQGGLDNAEAAAVLGLRVPQLTVLIHRAHEAFKREYLKMFPQTEIFKPQSR